MALALELAEFPIVVRSRVHYFCLYRHQCREHLFGCVRFLGAQLLTLRQQLSRVRLAMELTCALHQSF